MADGGKPELEAKCGRGSAAESRPRLTGGVSCVESAMVSVVVGREPHIVPPSDGAVLLLREEGTRPRSDARNASRMCPRFGEGRYQ
jgi:hypothetical protein